MFPTAVTCVRERAVSPPNYGPLFLAVLVALLQIRPLGEGRKEGDDAPLQNSPEHLGICATAMTCRGYRDL